ncbi:MAG: hypothetical protein IKI99_04600, partial [Firmicutes bacterium]|nr:hypothetical protein [Bacillota bacterium]
NFKAAASEAAKIVIEKRPVYLSELEIHDVDSVTGKAKNKEGQEVPGTFHIVDEESFLNLPAGTHQVEVEFIPDEEASRIYYGATGMAAYVVTPSEDPDGDNNPDDDDNEPDDGDKDPVDDDKNPDDGDKDPADDDNEPDDGDKDPAGDKDPDGDKKPDGNKDPDSESGDGSGGDDADGSNAGNEAGDERPGDSESGSANDRDGDDKQDSHQDEEQGENGATVSDDETYPDTGDRNPFELYLMLAAGALTAWVVLMKSRKTER